jgi:hypothetical protein
MVLRPYGVLWVSSGCHQSFLDLLHLGFGNTLRIWSIVEDLVSIMHCKHISGIDSAVHSNSLGYCRISASQIGSWSPLR